MNIADIFAGFRGTSQPTPAAPAAPGTTTPQGTTQPGVLPQGETSALEVNKADPNAKPPQGTTTTNAPPANPLDEFNKIWDNVNTGSTNVPSLNADPVKIGEAARKIDFSKSVSPALVQKALGGDAEAFMQVLNQVSQQTFAVATQASTHLVDRHTAAVRDHMQSELPANLRKFQAEDQLLAGNSRLAHPAIQPLVKVIQQQFAAQFPQATSAELNAHALKYLNGVMTVLAPEGTDFSAPKGTKAQQEAQAKGLFDWGGWAEPTSQQ